VEQIKVGFGELSDGADTLGRTAKAIEQHLDTLASQVNALNEVWTGAASEGFQRTVMQWQQAAGDLRESLTRLERIVRTAHTNYCSAVTTNTRMWPTR
jgi:6 kDa early secretory antigenic target